MKRRKMTRERRMQVNRYKAQLRNRATVYEQHLRELLTTLGIKFIFQKRIGHYIVDFWLTDYPLAFELDGKHHYLNPRQVQYDKARDRFIRSYIRRNGSVRDWRMFRLPNRLVYQTAMFESIFRDPTNVWRAKAIIEGEIGRLETSGDPPIQADPPKAPVA